MPAGGTPKPSPCSPSPRTSLPTRPGEKATVYIPAAEGARALVSLENAGGVLRREWVKLSAQDTPWSFTVTPDMAPNIYVNITLLQPYGNTLNDLPIRLYGVQRVKVEDPASRLQPVLSMPDKLHPEEAFTVKVSEKSGRPMTYTLAIVDEGLLDLTAFKTPDPWSQMYGERGPGRQDLGPLRPGDRCVQRTLLAAGGHRR